MFTYNNYNTALSASLCYTAPSFERTRPKISGKSEVRTSLKDVYFSEGSKMMEAAVTEVDLAATVSDLVEDAVG